MAVGSSWLTQRRADSTGLSALGSAVRRPVLLAGLVLAICACAAGNVSQDECQAGSGMCPSSPVPHPAPPSPHAPQGSGAEQQARPIKENEEGVQDGGRAPVGEQQQQQQQHRIENDSRMEEWRKRRQQVDSTDSKRAGKPREAAGTVLPPPPPPPPQAHAAVTAAEMRRREEEQQRQAEVDRRNKEKKARAAEERAKARRRRIAEEQTAQKRHKEESAAAEAATEAQRFAGAAEQQKLEAANAAAVSSATAQVFEAQGNEDQTERKQEAADAPAAQGAAATKVPVSENEAQEKMEEVAPTVAAASEATAQALETRGNEEEAERKQETADAPAAAEAPAAQDAAATKVQVSEDEAEEKMEEVAAQNVAAAPDMSQPIKPKPGERDRRDPPVIVIEQEDTGRTGIVNYSGPADEDQSLDYLITLAGKGVRILASGAVAGLRRAHFLMKSTAEKVSRRPLAETLQLWLGVNESGPADNMHAAEKALMSVKHTTAVALARAPETIERYKQILDQVAQRSVERGLEVAVITAEVATTVGSVSMQIARSTRAKIEVALASPEGQAAQAWARATLDRVWLAGQEAAKVAANRVLWVIADRSQWLPSPGVVETGSGLLYIYRDTNNIHSNVPVFTKSHQFLGTFLDEDGEDPKDTSDVNDDTVHDNTSKEGQGSGAGGERKRRDLGLEKCANECWMMTHRALEACQGFRFAGGALIDDESRASCPVCRSFVFYGSKHSNTKLVGKCFAITSESWAPVYEQHVTSGVFQVKAMSNAHSGKEEKGPAALTSGEQTGVLVEVETAGVEASSDEQASGRQDERQENGRETAQSTFSA